VLASGGLSQLPWAGLLIAATFTLYSALRKLLPLQPLLGLTLETALASIPAALFLMGAAWQVPQEHSYAPHDHLLLICIGLVTTLPMLFYVISLRRLPMTMVSQLQYLNPSLMFLIAVVLFREPLSALKLLGFVLICSALLHQVLMSWRSRAVGPVAPKLHDAGS
jgi:chloramphenicol-sensitive protein RarD